MIPASWASIQDWMRMVALQVNPLLQGKPPLILPSAPSDPFEGMEYYDSTLHKKRCFDGTNWQNFW